MRAARPVRAARTRRREAATAVKRRGDDAGEPRDAAVGAREHAVQRGERPDGERQVVRLAPDGVRQLLAEEVRQPDGGHQLGGGHAEPDRERPVRGRERHEHLAERDRDDAVEEERRAVQRHEDPGEDREEAVHLLDREARPGEAARARTSARRGSPRPRGAGRRRARRSARSTRRPATSGRKRRSGAHCCQVSVSWTAP